MDDIISSLGVGSGINSRQVVDDLVAAERTARTTPLTTRLEALTARISALGQLRGALQGIATSLDTRVRSGALGLVPQSSNAAGASIERRGTGPLASFSSNLVVEKLASGQRVAAAPLAGPDSPVGEGTLTFSFGRRTELVGGGFSFSGGSVPGMDIVITAENNSLTGLRDAINRAAGPVTATIVNGTGGATLSLRGRDGADYAFVISAAQTPPPPPDPLVPVDPLAPPVVPAPGLSRFSYTPGDPQLAISARAGDAELQLDGVAVQRDSNVVDDLIVGTRLVLKAPTGAEGLTISAERSASALAETVSDFAGALGAMRDLIRDFRRTPQSGEGEGPLTSDITSRGMDQRIVSLINTPVEAAGGLRLRDIGVSVTREGGVQFDADRLASLTPSQQAQAEQLLRSLSGPASTTQPARLQSIAALATPATDGLERRQALLRADLAKVDVRLEAYRSVLLRQFAAMDRLVAANKAVGEQLDQQIAIWSNSDN